jgi:hypothetical protein
MTSAEAASTKAIIPFPLVKDAAYSTLRSSFAHFAGSCFLPMRIESSSSGLFAMVHLRPDISM